MILKLDKLCLWFFVLNLMGMLPSVLHVKYLDELFSFLLAVVAVLDIVVNRKFYRHVPFMILCVVFLFYFLYSITVVHFNSVPYVAMDAVIEAKPFVPVMVMIAMRPRFDAITRKVVEITCIVNVVASLVLMLMGERVVVAAIGHVAYVGASCFISALAYFMVKLKPDGTLSRGSLAVGIVMLLIGLSCMKAKYYGEFVMAMFFLFAYRPGMTRSLKPVHIVVVLATLVIVGVVTWNKFSYYFLTGNSDTIDINTIHTFARPVLYVTAGMILVDYFPFGSGLASFASYPSSISYSDLYYEYGINTVWGMSPDFPDFICDAYYPLLAQFGFVGIGLFIWFLRWCYKNLLPLIRSNPERNKILFSLGSLCLVFVVIESTSGTMFSQQQGMISMMLLGLCCSQCDVRSQAPEVVNTLKNKKTETQHIST